MSTMRFLPRSARRFSSSRRLSCSARVRVAVAIAGVQWLSKVLTPWVGWGGVGSAEVADRALRLSRPDALMPSTAPGKARCAELFPPGARHLVTLGNVADRYTHPDDQPDPPETLQ